MLVISKNMTNITLTILLSSASATSENFTGCSGPWFPVGIQKSISPPHWWLHEASLILFESLDDILTDLNLTLLLIIIQHQFCNDYRHVQIFGDNLPKTDFFISCWLAIIRIVTLWSLHTICFTRSKLSSILIVEGLSPLKTSLTSPYPSLKLFCHLKTRVYNMLLYPYTCWSISSDFDRVLLNRAKNFRFIRVL